MLFGGFEAFEYLTLALPYFREISHDGWKSGIIESVGEIEGEIAKKPQGITARQSP
jgi:hypothetical protein